VGPAHEVQGVQTNQGLKVVMQAFSMQGAQLIPLFKKLTVLRK
jgi:hypothetical protein